MPKVAKCPDCLTPSNLKAISAQLLEALKGNTIDGHIFGCPAGWKADRGCSPLCLNTNAAIKLAQTG